MKQFNSLQELWSYCLFCPICRDTCRDISISVGPDSQFKFISYKKRDQFLYLFCTFQQRKLPKYKVDFVFDTIKNVYKVETTDIIEVSTDGDMNADKNLEEEERHRLRHRVTNLYFYFYIHSDCKKCGIAHTNSADVELVASKRIIESFQIERDSVYILEPNDKYHLTISYDTGKALISKCSIDDITYEIIDDEKTFECPIVNFDFSNPQKVINKIKTLITFS